MQLFTDLLVTVGCYRCLWLIVVLYCTSPAQLKCGLHTCALLTEREGPRGEEDLQNKIRWRLQSWLDYLFWVNQRLFCFILKTVQQNNVEACSCFHSGVLEYWIEKGESPSCACCASDWLYSSNYICWIAGWIILGVCVCESSIFLPACCIPQSLHCHH